VFLARIIAFQGVVLMLQNKRPEMGKPEIVWSSQSNLTNVFSMKYLEREYVRRMSHRILVFFGSACVP